jgi:hypothetical protein
MKCDHVGKVVKFGYKLVDGQMESHVDLWGCSKCDETSTEPLYDMADNFTVKEPCKTDCDCFGCKAKGLQLSTGDANGRRTMSAKAYDGELKAYSDAVRQGIEPATTNMKDIQSAVELSNLAGKAFDSTDNSFKG